MYGDLWEGVTTIGVAAGHVSARVPRVRVGHQDLVNAGDGAGRGHPAAACTLIIIVKLREREGERVDLGRSLKGHL